MADITSKPITHGNLIAYTQEQYLELKQLEYRVEDICPMTAFGVIYGPSGGGKSFVTLDLAMAMAEGIPWFGHQTVRSRVWYLVLEGERGFQTRIKAIMLHRGGGSDNIRFVTGRFSIVSEKEVTDLVAFILANGGADAVVVDTLNQGALGTHENSSSDMGRVIAGASYLQQQLQALVILVHHSGKSEERGPRGHSSLYAAADFVMHVSCKAAQGEITLVKSKDGPSGLSHSYRLESVELGESPTGKPLTSCVVVPADDSLQHQVMPKVRGKNQEAVFYALLEQFMPEKINYDMGYSDTRPEIAFDDAVDRFADELSHVGPKHAKSRAKEALTALVSSGALRLDGGMITLPVH